MNERRILVVAHAGRVETVEAARRVIGALRGAGAQPLLAADDHAALTAVDAFFADVAVLDASSDSAELELAIVLGGDGTILRAAELVRDSGAPVLGINMGHVGFLAEIDRDDMDDAVRRVIDRDYEVEERLALSVRVKDAAGAVVYDTWALNEATVEKASRERMIEVVLEIDGRPLSSFACDGMVISTPTGSTAYNFSAGGPVIWPSVEAIAVVPLSAHALFAKPLVVSPDAAVAIEMLERTDGSGILWCDGRRSHELPPGARVVVRRSSRPVRLARLHHAAFTDRLVRKFRLPVEGWRGQEPGKTPMIEEMRMQGLGVIADAVLPLGPGFTAITGETGAGKTMVVTGLGLLLGQRADSGAVRAGSAQASVAGVWIVPEKGDVADIVTDAGGELEPAGEDRAELYVSRTLSAEGRSRASVGGRAAPAGVLSALAEELVVVHGQSEQLRLRSAAAQRDALDRFGGAPIAKALDAYTASFARWRTLDTEIAEISGNRDRRAEEAARLREALALIEATAPEPGEDQELSERAERLANSEELRLAASLAHGALSSEEGEPDAAALVAESRRLLERVSDTKLTEISESLADIGYRIADAAGLLSAYLADLDESGPHELAAVEERRAALGTLIRAHGSLDEALEVWRTGSARLAELDDDGERIERLIVERDAVRAELDGHAAALTAERTSAATRLGAAVTEELHALAMPDARLEVAVTEGSESTHGRDDVAILLAPHPGADPRAVGKGASGGELSRVMLAIEVVIAGTDPVPTFVFDEVDAGIGGAAAIEVGRRLARLAEKSQVIAVTHLAQVAAFANNHLSVVKANDGAVTASSVRLLKGEEREAEMARLLSGLADSDAALTHARELLSLGAPAA